MNTNKIIDITIACFAGLCLFIYITGWSIVYPSNINWLFISGDSATHYLGWIFFKNSPIFQWPIGANTNYGMEISSSVLFTDSIPLLAFIFKPFKTYISNEFQYDGIWILICFILQSCVTWIILRKFTDNRLIPILSAVLITISPIFLYRIEWHHALLSHWVLLVSIYFYINRSKDKYWISLLLITSMLHMYLLVMVLLMWITSLFNRILELKINLRSVLINILLGIITITLSLYAQGAFMNGTNLQTTHFGILRMNLLAPLDSDGWSRIIPNVLSPEGDYEGFNYLGIGTIFLLIIVIAHISIYKNRFFLNNYKFLIPILITVSIFFIYSLSNNIGIGSIQLFNYDLPNFIKTFCNTFRVSGRFFWIPYYLINFWVLWYCLTNFRNLTCNILLVMAILISLYDTYPNISKIKNTINNPAPYNSPLKSSFWELNKKNYDSIIYVPPLNMSKDWLPLSVYAAFNQMKINTGYFGRVDSIRQGNAREQIIKDVLNGNLSENSIYVFEERKLWEMAGTSIPKGYVADTIDNFNIIYYRKE